MTPDSHCRHSRGRPGRRLGASAAAAVIAAAVLVGCSSSNSGSSGSQSTPAGSTTSGATSPSSAQTGGAATGGDLPAPTPNPNPTPLDQLTINGSNPVLTLDNAKAGDITSLDIAYLSQGMLFRVAPDGVTLVPDVAASSELSADGLTFTVNLRPDAVYSDGTPVTPADVVAAFKHGKAGLWGPTVLSSVTEAKASGDHQVQFTLAFPDPDIARELTDRALAINPADKVANDPDYFNHPVSAGPYMLQNYVPGQQDVTLVENPKYWGGPMMAKKIVLLGVADDATRTLQIQSGDIDIAWKVPYASKDAVSSVAYTTVGAIGGYQDLFVNATNNDVFAKPEVRKAMSLALDRDAISKRVYSGLLPARTSWLWRCGDLCEPNLLPNGGKQDIQAAKDLLTQAGVTTPISAELTVAPADLQPDEAVAIQDQLKAIGINITIKQLDTAAASDALHNRKYQLYLGSGAQITPAAGLLTFFSGEGYNSDYTGIKDAQLTDLANQGKRELDPAKRKEIFTKAQERANEVMPVIPILERIQVNSFNKKLPAGIATIPTNTQILNIQSVAEAKAGKSAGEGA